MLRIYRLLHLTMLMQMGLSIALWWPGAGRTFPLLPLFAFLTVVPEWVSGVFSSVFILVTLAYAGGKLPVHRYAPMAITLMLLLVALDLNRLQVWVWTWILLWLADIDLWRKNDNPPPFSLHIYILAGIYTWSGIHKMTPWFSTNFNWFCEAFQLTAPFSGHLWLSYAAAVFEFLLAPLLLWPSTRRTGIWLAIVLHSYILLVIGPFGYTYNEVVWPWNMAMIGLVWYFFYEKTPVYFRLNMTGILVLVLVWVMPALNIWGYWPESLSWKMYANTQREATIYVPAGSPCERLAPIWEKYATDGQYLLIDDWTTDELHVPAFNSMRNFKNALQEVKNCAPDSARIQLKVLTVSRISRNGNLQVETTY